MPGHDAGDIENEQSAEGQETGQHDSDPSLVHALGAEDPLHQRLVVRPEIDAQHGHSHQQSQPRSGRIVEGPDESGRDVAVFHQSGEVFSTTFDKADDHHDDGSHQKYHGLDQIRVDGGGKTARNRVRGGDDGKDQDEHPEFHFREEKLQDERGGVEGASRIEKNVADDTDGGKIIPRPAVESFLQEFRNREDLGLNI